MSKTIQRDFGHSPSVYYASPYPENRRGHAMREAVTRMAVLLSALPFKGRTIARSELVGQVDDLMGAGGGTPSAIPIDSVIRREIREIAVQLAEAFQASHTGQHMVLWGDFAVDVNNLLEKIEATAKDVIGRIGQQ